MATVGFERPIELERDLLAAQHEEVVGPELVPLQVHLDMPERGMDVLLGSVTAWRKCNPVSSGLTAQYLHKVLLYPLVELCFIQRQSEWLACPHEKLEIPFFLSQAVRDLWICLNR
jgi:hypothetical protein